MKHLRIYVDLALSEIALELLKKGTTGHQLLFPQKPTASVLHKAERDPQFATADVAFGQPDPEAIAECPHLKWVHISSSGITRYDNAAFRRMVEDRNMPVSNSATVYSEACAVHALSFILAQARCLPAALNTRASNGTVAWKALRGSSKTLRGETVLIVGYGAIGKRLAELLAPLQMTVRACRRRPKGDEAVPVITEAELPQVLTATDHVVNILPESGETRHFFDETRLGLIKAGAVFYNIGRGATVDQDALLKALRSGQLSAAWLDVTEPEPLPRDHPLLHQPNCFITPHIAGGHADETTTLVRHFLDNLNRFVRGEALADRVM